jgi:hypothetical protein
LLFFIVTRPGIFSNNHEELVNEIHEMKSIIEVTLFPNPGSSLVPTVNCFTWGGIAVLGHKDFDVVEKDYSRLHEMEEQGLFQLVSDLEK